MAGLPQGTPVRLVGHSWGADTAAQIVARLGDDGRRVESLVTIDPVGRGTSDRFFARVRRGAGQWINVRATGGGAFEPSNFVAALGSPYGRGPRGHATAFIEAPYRHRDFWDMLTFAGPDGLSAIDVASGRGRPK